MGLLSRNNAKDEKNKRGTVDPASVPKDDFVQDDLSTVPGLGGHMELGASTGHAADEIVRETVDLTAQDDGPDYGSGEGDEDPHSYTSKPQRSLGGLHSLTLTALAKNYLGAGIDNFRRVPNAALTEGFRAQLLKIRQFLTILTQKGVKGEARLVIGMVAVLATDRMGQIEAVQFLRQLMRQLLWLASNDIARLRKPARERDERRDPPLGMADMSDHSDAIGGIAGPDTNPAAEQTEDDVFGALVELNGFLSAVADTIPTNPEEREFLQLTSGLPYTDKRSPDPAMPKGERWDPVYDADEAMDIQLIVNAANMVKRDERNAARRLTQLDQLAKIFG